MSKRARVIAPWAVLFVGALLIFWGAACTAGQFRSGVEGVKVGKDFVPIPAGVDGVVAAYLQQLADRTDAVIAEKVAAGTQDENLGWDEWLKILLGIGGGGGAAYAAARSSAAKKDQAVERRTEFSLQDLARAVAQITATPSAARSPEVVATTLTEALPGDASVKAAEVKPATKEAA